MREVVLVPAAVDGFNSLECRQFRQDIGHESGLVHKAEGHRGARCEEHLVQFVTDSLLRKNGESRSHTLHRLHRFGDYAERAFGHAQAACKTNCPEHTQGVVGIGGIGVERGAYDALVKVAYSAERVNQFAERIALETEGHSIDGKVSAKLVVFDGTVLDYGLARLSAIRLAPRPDEFDFVAFEVEHRGSEILEIRYLLAGSLADGHRKVNTASFDHDVYVLAVIAQETVADIAPDYKGADALFGGHLTDYPEDAFVKILGECYRHSIFS